MPSSLDGGGQLPLVIGAGAGDSAGQDFGPIAYELAQESLIFVVDVIGSLLAEAAGALPPSFFILHLFPPGGQTWR